MNNKNINKSKQKIAGLKPNLTLNVNLFYFCSKIPVNINIIK